MDSGTWRAMVHRVTQSRIQLKQLRMHACMGFHLWKEGSSGKILRWGRRVTRFQHHEESGTGAHAQNHQWGNQLGDYVKDSCQVVAEFLHQGHQISEGMSLWAGDKGSTKEPGALNRHLAIPKHLPNTDLCRKRAEWGPAVRGAAASRATS